MQKELDKLQGTWNITALEMDGQAMPDAYLNGARIIVRGDRFTTTAMGATYEGTLRVDPKPSPKQFDLNFTDGPEKGNSAPGIYELDGDTWRICLAVTARTRPTAFATKPGSGHALETLTRGAAPGDQPAKPKAGAKTSESTRERQGGDAPAGKSTPPDPDLDGEWTMVSCVRDGQPLDKSMIRTARRVARGDETTVSFGGQVFVQAKFSVDRTKKPKHIDYVLTLGPQAGAMQHGIYEFEGNAVKFCFSAPGGSRPDKFESTPGDGRTLAVWKPVAER